MLHKVTPYLWFDRNAEEAMNYYVSVFKNSRIISVDRYPADVPDGPMKGFEGKVLNGLFELEGQQFLALDGGPLFPFSEAISMHVLCEDQAEVDYYWEKLSAHPENEQCGWCKDKFGLSWQIIPKQLGQLMTDSNTTKAKSVTNAMLQMKKIDIDGLQRAYDKA